MNFVGIDPGQNGAIVALSHEGKIKQVIKMPLNKEEIPCYEQLKKIFINLTKDNDCMIFLERAVSFGMGSKGAFTYGRGFAAIECALKDLMLPYTMAEPGKWTKEMFQGIDSKLKPKVQALIAVDRLFADQKHHIPVSPKAQKPHDGVVDALLIAEYGRRKYALQS